MSSPIRRRAAFAALGAAAALVTAACTPATVETPAPTSTAPAPASTAPAVGASGVPNAKGGGIAADTTFTPIVGSTYTTPVPVRGTDGRTHLAYELVLTDALNLPFQLQRVEVRDAATQAVLQTVSDAQLGADVTLIFNASREAGATPPATPAPMTPGSSSVVWLDVTIPEGAAVPSRLEHRVVGTLALPSGESAPLDQVITTVDVAQEPPPVLGWPVPAGDWYMSDGCCADDTHHRRGLAPVNGQLMVPQRFAIDFYLLDDQHRAWVGDPATLTSHLAYQKPIFAAAAGTVVAAQDGLPNNPSLPKPPTIPGITDTVGNHVIQQIGPDQYLLYAHMDTGSVKVEIGQRVEKGQELGLIGTSGNSTVPHVHFQVLTQPSFFPSDSTPFVFESFELTGRITQRIWDDTLGLQPTGALPFEAANPGGVRTDEMPLDRAVVRVPGS